MQVRVRRRTLRLRAGESALTRLNRVKGLIEAYKDGGLPKPVIRALVEYHTLLQSLWVWQLKKGEASEVCLS
jgi:hypothetical protein